MSGANLELSRRPDGALDVTMAGEYDIATVEQLAPEIEALMASGEGAVVVEMSRVTFMDTSGVALLIRIANHFRSVEVRGITPTVRRAIDLLGLADRLGLEQP